MFASRRKPPRKHSRRGYVLILVVLLLFGIMAMAALVIDIGFARLTQRQMQTAVDAASLEGLRFRDGSPPGATSTDFDTARRLATARVAAQVFDDNLLSDDDDPWNFGAGPIIQFSQGAGDPSLTASQKMTIPSSSVYKPSGDRELRPNLMNAAEGDMVAGNYATYAGPSASAVEQRNFHLEDANYQRMDFPTPAPTLPSTFPAFLVRMRRTNEDFSTATGIASNGPALPYLFARGSLFRRGDDPNQPELGQGIPVRATAIAHAQPVICVGKANAMHGVIGHLGLAVSLNDWNNAAQNTMMDFFDVTGNAIGDSVPIARSPRVFPTTTEGYMAIFQDFGGSVGRRVIGFGHASITNTAVTKLSTGTGVKQIATANASAVFCYPPSVSSNILATVLAANRQLAARNDILLAPVSGR